MGKKILYLNGNFFYPNSDSEYFTFLNKNNGLIYLKRGKNYYRQINEDNSFAYVKDNTVSELKDLTSTYWTAIYESDHENGTDRLYKYVIDKLSKFKKPKDNYLLAIKSSIGVKTSIFINGSQQKIYMDELLYVPKRVKDEELKLYTILVTKDEVFLWFSRFLSDGSYDVIYDKDFNVVKEGDLNEFNDSLWNYLKNYRNNGEE